MSHAFTVSALLVALSTRRDLLLEMVALRHQLAVYLSVLRIWRAVSTDVTVQGLSLCEKRGNTLATTVSGDRSCDIDEYIELV